MSPDELRNLADTNPANLNAIAPQIAHLAADMAEELNFYLDPARTRALAAVGGGHRHARALLERFTNLGEQPA